MYHDSAGLVRFVSWRWIMTFFYDDDLDKFSNKFLIVFNGEKKTTVMHSPTCTVQYLSNVWNQTRNLSALASSYPDIGVILHRLGLNAIFWVCTEGVEPEEEDEKEEPPEGDDPHPGGDRPGSSLPITIYPQTDSNFKC